MRGDINFSADNQNPVITCPGPQSFQVNCGISSSQFQIEKATATDNCGTANIAYSSGNIQFFDIGNRLLATFPTGTTNVQATATDGSGRTATCDITVTVTQSKLV